ncbi:hypothetical protein [Cupriavidus plantarum]|uniref:hypothetical protein n=1 Tax=Cupriavidus plantarum TaxID=942865 RepID=UPI001BAAAB6B|nr:hypothetical protein [Cupriavidus plantarum]
MSRSWERLKFEQELENARAATFPDRVSRITGLYVFDTPESALAATEGWGGHINHENLTDVGVSAAPNKTRVDANWITWMLREYEARNSEWGHGIDRYWGGEPCPFFPEPIWEVLLDGAVTIWGTRLRRRAYDLIRELSPMSLALLEQSRLAATLGSDLGHITALLTLENDRPLMSFHTDMRDAQNSEYTDRLHKHIAAHPELVNHHDLTIGGGIFRMPNFASYSYAFE